MSIICEMLHTAFKKCGFGMHPGMIEIGHPVKGEDRGTTVLSLIKRPQEIVEVPVRSRRARSWNEKRIVLLGIIGRAATTFPIIRIFGYSATSGISKTAFFEQLNSFGGIGVARITKCGGNRDTVVVALPIDVEDIG